MRRTFAVFLAGLVASFGPTVSAAPGGEAPALPPPDAGNEPVRPPAVDAAFGTPPADATYGPDTTADPGYAERRNGAGVDQTYGPTGQTTNPDGSVSNGLQIYDEPLLSDDPNGAEPNVPEYHVVQRGDTLWDISGYYFGDPYAWPRLWSWNEHVTNAHWIFPGDRVSLFEPGRTAGGTDGPSMRFSKTRLPDAAQQRTYLLNQYAFVDKDKFETSMKVIGGAEAAVMMSTLDTVYMSYDRDNPPVSGERLVVYAPFEKIYDLKSKKVIGYLVQIMGEVDVDRVARKAAEGTVANSLNPIERGYRVGPLRRQFRRVETTTADKSAVGRIVDTIISTGPIAVGKPRKKKLYGDYVLTGEEQFAVVDIGSDEGVRVGNVLEVVRKGDEYTPKRVFHIPYEDGWPRRVIGAILIIDVQEESALGFVVFSRRELERGDYVELRGPGLDDGTHQDAGRSMDADADAEVGDGKAKGRASVTLGK